MSRIIGFTQGTFDMFHIGHLNLLKNAANHCDYLIIGVNTDELVQSYKSKVPIIPFEERMEIVASIRYVDEVIGMDTLDKEVACRRRPFHRLFIGDDWKGSPRWIETERTMTRYGVEVIYLPYTKSTSSTIIRERLLAY